METTCFKALDVNGYGWYAYAEDNIFVLGEDHPGDGRELYYGEFNEDKIPYLKEFKRDCPEEYDDAVNYFRNRQENKTLTITESEKEVLIDALNHYANYCNDMKSVCMTKGYYDLSDEYCGYLSTARQMVDNIYDMK